MSDLSPHSRDDLVELPCDCGDTNDIPQSGLVQLARLPAPYRDGTTVGPQAAARPRILYTINSDRPRWQIIRDHAHAHNLTVAQIDELVRALPDYGLRSQLHGSLALLREMRELWPSAEVVCLAEKRALLVRNAGRGV